MNIIVARPYTNNPNIKNLFLYNVVNLFTKKEVQYIVDGKNRENIKEVNRLKKEVIEKNKRIEQLEMQVASFLKKT